MKTATLSDAEQRRLFLHPSDGQRAPASVESVTFLSSDAAVATVTQDEDLPLEAVLVGVAPGTCQITITADTTIGAGTHTISEFLSVSVVAAGEAVRLALEAGDPMEPGETEPDTPDNVVATPGDSLVVLTWDAVTGATSYTVKRGPNGGPYSAIVTGVLSPTYTNTGLTNGVTYHYVIVAVNGIGSSGDSDDVGGTPYAVPTVSMAGSRAGHAPYLVDQLGNQWSQTHPEGGEVISSYLLKNGELVTSFNGSPAPGGIQVGSWLVWGGVTKGVQFWASNFHAYRIESDEDGDTFVDQGASSGDDHGPDFWFPFYFEDLPAIDNTVPDGAYTIFTDETITPVRGETLHVSGDASLELGTQFSTAVDGAITHIRFYKPSTDYPAPFDTIPQEPYHVGRIWNSDGDILVEQVFRAESGDGWQQMELDTPLSLPTGDDYVVSVSSFILDCYCHADGVFASPIVNGPLTGTKGVFGLQDTFPTSVGWTSPYVHSIHPYDDTSFAVDVIFVPTMLLKPEDVTYLGKHDLIGTRGSGPFCMGLTSRRVDGDFRLLLVGNDGATPGQLFELSLNGLELGDTLSAITNKWQLPVLGDLVGDSQGIFWDDDLNALWWFGCYDYDDDGIVRIRIIDLTTDAPVETLEEYYIGYGTTTLLRDKIALEGVHSKKVDRGVLVPPAWWGERYGITQRRLIGYGGYHSKVATGVSLGLSLFAIPNPLGYADDTAIPAEDIVTVADHPFHEADWYSDSPTIPTTFDRGWRLSTVENYFDGGDEFRPDNNQEHFGEPGNNGPRPDFPPTPHARWLSPAPDGHGRWTQGDVLKGAVWVDTPRRTGLVAFPSLQSGKCWYSCAKGTIDSETFEMQIFDPAVLGAAAQGSLEPCLVQPDSITALTLPGLGDGGQFPISHIDGAVYDDVLKRIYAICYGTNDNGNFQTDRIYVFGVDA